MAKTEKVRVTAYLPQQLARQVRVFAAEEGVSMTDVFQDALEAYIKSRRAKP